MIAVKRPRLGAVIVKFGAGSRSRTHDLRFTKPLLYQLSYAGPALQSALFYNLQVLRPVARLAVRR